LALNQVKEYATLCGIVLVVKITTHRKTNTIADGARSKSLQINVSHCFRNVQDMVTVSDAAIARSMFYLWLG
jgi:threonine dehydratase